MWLSGVFSVIYVIAVCSAQDPPDVSPSDDSPTSTQPIPLRTTPVYVPPVPQLQKKTSWLDVFPSERLELSCGVSGSSDWTFSWYRNEEKLTPGPTILFQRHGALLAVIATPEHEGGYTCQGEHKITKVSTQRSNSLSVKVYENLPKPTVTRSSSLNPTFLGESHTLTCKLDVSSGWEYEWTRNGEMIQVVSKMYFMPSVDHEKSGQYQCKAKRGRVPLYTQTSESTALQVSDPPTPSAKLDTSWPDVFEGEVVEFGCEVSGSEWKYTWYRNQEKLEEDSEVTLDDEEGMLNITSVLQSHKGGYSCKAHHTSRGVSSGFSNTVKITVYENIPKPTLSKDPVFNPMFVGETVNLTCRVSVSSGWEFQWYKDGDELSDTSEAISVLLDPLGGGEYSCRASRASTTSTAPSEKILQEVIAIPVPSLKPVSKWLEVFPSESVKLLCEMQGDSGWKYTWHKGNEMLQSDDTVSFGPEGATLFINTASARHAGQYECRGHLQDRTVHSRLSAQLTLTVYDKKPRVTMTQYPDYKVMFPDERVTFTCNIDVSSEWEYLWYNEGKKLDAAQNNHSLKLGGKMDGGSYKCQARRGNEEVFTTALSQAVLLQVEDIKPKPAITQQPDVHKMYTGEPVSFECNVEASSGWSYNWYKDGAPLQTNSSRFNIVGAGLVNSGTYKCQATRDMTAVSTEHSDGKTLSISEIPTPSLKQVTHWLDVFPTEAVKLSCGMRQGSSSWKYVWYKDTAEVRGDGLVTFDPDGTTLSISSASASHRGKYKCLGRLKSRSVVSNSSSELTLRVYDTKPKVTLVQNPSDGLLHTGDSVSFGCGVGVSSGWEYMWYKDGSPLGTSRSNHSIGSVETDHTGSYTCQVKRGKDAIFRSDKSLTIRLDVEERPQASIILLTGWSEVFSTDSLMLRCSVEGSNDAWNYTWFREDEQMELSHSEKHVVTPQNDQDQSVYTCKGVRSGRPSYSKTSSSFGTKNLLLKRRVLLSISGVIFFGIIAVFLGCFILRFFRKPAEADRKAEEPIYFPSVTQMKDLSTADAPCPLVEYITDASLVQSPKEGEENGTVCSETSPLPITLPEENGTADGHEEENNVPLLSFQQ